MLHNEDDLLSVYYHQKCLQSIKFDLWQPAPFTFPLLLAMFSSTVYSIFYTAYLAPY